MQRAKNENAETQVHDIKKEKPKSRPLEKKYRYKLSGIIDIYIQIKHVEIYDSVSVFVFLTPGAISWRETHGEEKHEKNQFGEKVSRIWTKKRKAIERIEDTGNDELFNGHFPKKEREVIQSSKTKSS